MKKCGANRLDQKRIIKLQEDGFAADEIGKILDIETNVVEKFMVVEEAVVEEETIVDESDDNSNEDFE